MATTTTATSDTTSHAPRQRGARRVAPLVDIYETATGYVLLADVPGLKPEGLEVIAERDSLTIRGRVDQPSRPPDYQEFDIDEYERVFSLTEDIDSDKISAALRDGVLRLDLPKVPGVQPRKIPVRSEA